jgi:ATP-dependent helicase/nuclease subunit B
MAARGTPWPDSLPLVVAPNEAEVRRHSGRGSRAVTRRDLLLRLRERLLPECVLASPMAIELAVSGLLIEIAKTTPWLLQIVERGGRARAGLVLSVVDALAEARRMLWFEALSTWRHAGSDAGGLVLARVARELDRELGGAGLFDPSAEKEFVARALGRASVEDVIDSIGARVVVAAGIFSWLPADLVFWRALDAKLSLGGGSATIELVAFERPLDATRERDPLERLSDAVAEGLDGAPRTRAIGQVLGDLRLVDSVPEAVRARVEVRRADSATSQASAIADAVHARLAEGACVDDVAVVVPDDAPAAPSANEQRANDARRARASIRRALEEAGIPVHATLPDAPAAGGLLAFALDALALADSGVPRIGLAKWLCSPYLDASRITGIAEGRKATASLHALARALRSTPTAMGEDLAATLAATVLASKSSAHADLAPLALLARRVAGLIARAREGRTRAEHSANASRLFDDLGIAARPGRAARAQFAHDSPARGVARAEILGFARDTRDLVALRSVLDEYARAARRLDARGDRSTFESFRFELEHALAREAGCGEARAAGAVRVCAWRDLPFRPRALLVVADAHEGAYGVSRGESPLLAGPLRAWLTEALDPALRASVLAAPAADLASLASAANESARVLFAYRTRDEQDGALAPHPLVAWLEEGGARVGVWRDRVTSDRPITERERTLARLARSPHEAIDLAPWAARRAATETRREEASGVPSPVAIDGGASPSMSEPFRAILTEETGGADRPMSVTSLDRFGSCRFQGFAAQVLRARAPEERRDDVDAREEGTLLHGALAAAFRATRQLWSARPRDSETIRGAAARAADAFLSRGLAVSGLRRAGLDGVRKGVLRVVEWSLADEEWDFAYAEEAFGQAEDGWREAILGDGRTMLRLRGSIDRVDVAHGRARLRVVDYKRSQDSARRFTDALGDTSFQIAVYGRAASAALGVAAVEGLYLPTLRLSPVGRSKGQAAAWASAHEPCEDAPRFERRALELVGRARQGDVAPHPSDPAVCQKCDFDGACRKPRFVIAALGGDDPDGSTPEGFP